MREPDNRPRRTTSGPDVDRNGRLETQPVSGCSGRMHRTVLLLNTVILVVNFFVSFGASESQVRVLRSTARTAYSGPVEVRVPAPGVRQSAPVPDSPARTPLSAHVRLLRYLTAVPEVRAFDDRQMATLFELFRDCCVRFASASDRLNAASHSGRRVIDEVSQLRRGLEEHVRMRLLDSCVDDGTVAMRLARILVVSVG